MYILGLDIGVTSVGFAVLEADINGEPIRIINMGSRIFTAAEQPKTGASLALPRRMARGARRRSRRRNHRKDRIRSAISKYVEISKDDISLIYDKKDLKNVYEIRYEALDKVIEKKDWIRLLIHLSQRRGFKSNRRSDNEGDAGKLLKAVSSNQDRMGEKKYRTIGEMIFKDEQFSKNIRNKASDYSNTFLRSQLVEEIKIIFDRQRTLGNKYACEEFETRYLEIYESQRSFEVGPGGESPYGGDQILKMIGYCTFEPDQLRATKATYTFQRI